MRLPSRSAVLLLLLLAIFASAVPAAATDFAVYGSWWDTEELGETAGGGLRLDLGQAFQVQLRASYYPDLTEDFGELIDDEDARFDFELEAIPLEAGIKISLGQGGGVRPFIGGGGTYYLLDSNFGEVDDEVGYYLTSGLEIGGGGGGGVGFFAEALYRYVEGTLSIDPEDIDDIEDVEIDDEIALDLSGLAVNAGVVFRF